jgi:hypothetical protein
VEGSSGELTRKLLSELAELRSARQNLAKALEDLASEALEKIRSAGLARRARCAEEAAMPCSGVDGSLQAIEIGLGGQLALIVVVIVSLDSLEKPPSLAYPYVRIVDAASSSPDTDRALQLAMLLKEAEAVGVAGGDVVFIDGPVVDPPGNVILSPEGVRMLGVALGMSHDKAEKVASRYHAIRASAIADKVKAGALVVGVVKRISGTRLLAEKVCTGCSDLDDAALLAALGALQQSWRTARGSYIGPLPAVSSALQDYRRAGIDVYSAYMFSPWTGRAYRVEVAVPAGSDPEPLLERAICAAQSHTLLGTNYPLPVVMAHEKSKVPRGLLRKLVVASLSSAASDEKAARYLSMVLEETEL